MSPELVTRRDGTTRPRRKGAVQPLAVLWLAVIWVVLWQDLSIANLVSGALLGVAVQLAFPLPPLRIDGRLRPLALLWLLISFVGQMLAASVEVSLQVLRLRSKPQSAVIEIDLETESDFVLTVVALITSLIPGSIVVEARRSTHSLFLHVLDAHNDQRIARERRRVLKVEKQVIRAFGITEERQGGGS